MAKSLTKIRLKLLSINLTLEYNLVYKSFSTSINVRKLPVKNKGRTWNIMKIGDLWIKTLPFGRIKPNTFLQVPTGTQLFLKVFRNK